MVYTVPQGLLQTVADLLDHQHFVHYRASVGFLGSFANLELLERHTTAAAVAVGDGEVAFGTLYCQGLLNLAGSLRLDPQIHLDRGKGDFVTWSYCKELSYSVLYLMMVEVQHQVQPEPDGCKRDIWACTPDHRMGWDT